MESDHAHRDGESLMKMQAGMSGIEFGKKRHYGIVNKVRTIWRRTVYSQKAKMDHVAARINTNIRCFLLSFGRET